MADRPKIVAIGQKAAASTVDGELIAMVKEILADAESGKLIGICGVCEYAGDEAATFFARGMDDEYRAWGLLDGLKEFIGEL